MHTFFHILGHTALDTALLVPFLLLTYLAMEWMEHKMGDGTRHVIERAGRFGPALGGLLGAVPQCGFSSAAAGLYAGRVISLGTLFAVFLSTSDEMLAVAISHLPDGSVSVGGILKILVAKVLMGMLFGFLIDLVLPKKHACHEKEHDHIGEMCEHHHCGCEKGIFRSAVIHTLEVALFIFIASFALDLVVHFVGEETLAAFLGGAGLLANLVAPLVGLIPNCAASVVITELYISGALSVGALYGGLLTGAGVGILVLFRTNRPFWENVLVALGLYGIGAVSGILIDLLGCSWLGL
jgi:uncharacterized membrane protein YraQ (UPF0718 family)